MKDPKNAKKFCPVNGWDCPYYKEGGLCTIENPVEECDDFAMFWDADDEFYVWDDEELDEAQREWNAEAEAMNGEG